MSEEAKQNEFGFFGKLPTRGDFIQQVLPQDFANSWHEWLQQSMATARESLREDFLRYYLNCPAWKFIISPGICGVQAVAGLTIPSVDKVGRYFNFTLATMLPMEADPCGYVIGNKTGMAALENLALDLLENDFSIEEVELKVRELSLQFTMAANAKHEIDAGTGHICIAQDRPLPFADQASALLTHLVKQNLEQFSMWWYGQAGQTRSQLVVCNGMPSADMYLRLLTLGDPPEQEENEIDYIDKVIAGEV